MGTRVTLDSTELWGKTLAGLGELVALQFMMLPERHRADELKNFCEFVRSIMESSDGPELVVEEVPDASH